MLKLKWRFRQVVVFSENLHFKKALWLNKTCLWSANLNLEYLKTISKSTIIERLFFAKKMPNCSAEKCQIQICRGFVKFTERIYLPAINKLELGTFENQTEFSHWLIICSFKTMSFVESMEELLLVSPVNMTLTSQPGKFNEFDFSSP